MRLQRRWPLIGWRALVEASRSTVATRGVAVSEGRSGVPFFGWSSDASARGTDPHSADNDHVLR